MKIKIDVEELRKGKPYTYLIGKFIKKELVS